ncbi:sulfatase-like hydrolase/transferase [Psychrosphaera algicola]|uniref:sulfatase-like hydrolase/transferase n=1 Tax=Psychrosphaera algicola TaxID=3023714 RepID=UPI002FEE3326
MKAQLKILFAMTLAALASGCGQSSQNATSTMNDNVMPEGSKHKVTPNVVIFYVDDLGYGDIGSYGAKGVETPELDRIAANGIRFTDGHSSAATCTPSRYSLLTGEHGFRNNAQILKGDAPALIQPGKPTMASMFKKRVIQPRLLVNGTLV